VNAVRIYWYPRRCDPHIRCAAEIYLDLTRDAYVGPPSVL
jgi:hypothetical protein